VHTGILHPRGSTLDGVRDGEAAAPTRRRSRKTTQLAAGTVKG